jgi:hypothetical protein
MTVTIRALAESFSDQRGNPRRACGQLLSHLRVSKETRVVDNGRNCIGSSVLNRTEDFIEGRRAEAEGRPQQYKGK